MQIFKLISNLQESRSPWALMSFVSMALVILAHSFFQNYLYMAPCEQCVYIRFAFICMALGGFIAIINPKNIFLRLIAYILSFWGAWQGIVYSLKLTKIHEAVHGDDPFGVQGCSTDPKYPFDLPLHEWAPDWFLPTGDCGYDSPMVPSDAVLNSFQNYFVNLYQDGWYLIPSKHFLSMADCTLFGFGFCFAILSMMFISMIISMVKKEK